MQANISTTLTPDSSIFKIAQIVRNAILHGPDGWESSSSNESDPNKTAHSNLLPTYSDVLELFTLLRNRKIAYLLVGDIAMLRYVDGRNTEDIDLLMSLPSVRQMPEIIIESQDEFFIRGHFKSVRVDVLLTANALFAEVQKGYGTSHKYTDLDVPIATPEGLILLKLYALPSLYRQGEFDRITVYESDIASLIQRRRPDVEPLLQKLQAHLETGDMHELRVIVKDFETRIARFEKLKKP